MADRNSMFDALPGCADEQRSSGSQKRTDEWQPISPVPDGAPKPDFRHHKFGEPTGHWAYRCAEGRILGYVVRFDSGEGRKQVLPYTFCRGPDGQQQWRWKGFPDPRPLYGLDQLAKRPDSPVLVTEGEKVADKAAELFPDFVVVTSPGGARAADKADWKVLIVRKVIIWPDNDDEGESYARGVASLCAKAAAVEVSIVQIPGSFPKKWDLADPPPDGWTIDQLQLLLRAAEIHAQTVPGMFQKLNDRHAVIMVGGKCAVLNEEWDPTFNRKMITFSSPADFKAYYANKVVRIDGNKITLGNFWWKSLKRRQYQGLVFDPAHQTPGYYNLWTGFAVEPKPGDCSLYLRHIQFVIARGDDEVYDYIIAWLADTVQNPSQRPGTSIVFRGKQGTGKGVCCTEFGKLFGQHFVHVQHARHLTGHFNAHLRDALVVFADEAFWAGDKSDQGALKAMVTEDQLPIEFKGKDVVYVRNHIRLMISSNHDWVVPAGLEERRFFVVDVSEARMQDQKYFAAIIEQMNNGGREALLHYLLNYDLTGVDLRTFPHTDALREQKIHSMSAVEKWWLDRLMTGTILTSDTGWRAVVPCSEVQEDFIGHAQAIGYSRRSSETELGTTLSKLVPGLHRGRRIIGGRRQYVYEFPPLVQCRGGFDKIMLTNNPWPDDED